MIDSIYNEYQTMAKSQIENETDLVRQDLIKKMHHHIDEASKMNTDLTAGADNSQAIKNINNNLFDVLHYRRQLDGIDISEVMDWDKQAIENFRESDAPLVGVCGQVATAAGLVQSNVGLTYSYYQNLLEYGKERDRSRIDLLYIALMHLTLIFDELYEEDAVDYEDDGDE